MLVIRDTHASNVIGRRIGASAIYAGVRTSIGGAGFALEPQLQQTNVTTATSIGSVPMDKLVLWSSPTGSSFAAPMLGRTTLVGGADLISPIAGTALGQTIAEILRSPYLRDSFWLAENIAVLPSGTSEVYRKDLFGFGVDINDPTWTLLGTNGVRTAWLKLDLERPTIIEADATGSDFSMARSIWSWDGIGVPVEVDSTRTPIAVTDDFSRTVAPNSTGDWGTGFATWRKLSGNVTTYEVTGGAATATGSGVTVYFEQGLDLPTANLSIPGWVTYLTFTWPASDSTPKKVMLSYYDSDSGNEGVYTEVQGDQLRVGWWTATDGDETFVATSMGGAGVVGHLALFWDSVAQVAKGKYWEGASAEPDWQSTLETTSSVTLSATPVLSLYAVESLSPSPNPTWSIDEVVFVVPDPNPPPITVQPGTYLIGVSQLTDDVTNRGAYLDITLTSIFTTFTSARSFDVGGIGTLTSERPFDILNQPLYILSFRPFDIAGPILVVSARPFDLGTGGMQWLSARPFDVIDATDGQPVDPGVYVPPPSSAVNEVQQIALTGTLTGGTFALTFNGDTTGPIAWDANAATIQSALEAISTIAPGDVTVSGGPLTSGNVLITFGGFYAGVNVPQITLSSLALVGTSPVLTVSTLTQGVPAGSPTGGTNTVQKIVITGSLSGGYTLTFDGQTTDLIPATATAAEVQSELEALSNIAPGDIEITSEIVVSSVVITAGDGSTSISWVTTQTFRIEFMGAYAGTNVPLITASPLTSLPAVNEVQQIVPSGTISGGTYTLTFSEQTTAAIAYDADAATVQAALEALSNVDPGDITVTGGPLSSGTLTLTFGGALAGLNVPQVTVDDSLLTGSGASATGTTPVDGTPVQPPATGDSVITSYVITGLPPSGTGFMPGMQVYDKQGIKLGEIHNFTLNQAPSRGVNFRGAMAFSVPRVLVSSTGSLVPNPDLSLLPDGKVVKGDRIVVLGDTLRPADPWGGVITDIEWTDGAAIVQAADIGDLLSTPRLPEDNEARATAAIKIATGTQASAIVNLLMSHANNWYGANGEVLWGVDATGSKAFFGDETVGGDPLSALEMVVERSFGEWCWRIEVGAASMRPVIVWRDFFTAPAGIDLIDGPEGNVVAGAALSTTLTTVVNAIRLTGSVTEIRSAIPKGATALPVRQLIPVAEVWLDANGYRRRFNDQSAGIIMNVEVPFTIDADTKAEEDAAAEAKKFALFKTFIHAFHEQFGRPWHDGWSWAGPEGSDEDAKDLERLLTVDKYVHCRLLGLSGQTAADAAEAGTITFETEQPVAVVMKNQPSGSTSYVRVFYDRINGVQDVARTSTLTIVPSDTVFAFEKRRYLAGDYDPRVSGVGEETPYHTVKAGTTVTSSWRVVPYGVGDQSGTTQLAYGIDASTTNIPVVSVYVLPTTFPYVVTVGYDEQMLVTGTSLNVLIVQRGYNNTTPSIHERGEPVEYKVVDPEEENDPADEDLPPQEIPWPSGEAYARLLLAKLANPKRVLTVHLANVGGDWASVQIGSTHQVNIQSEGPAEGILAGVRVIGFTSDFDRGAMELLLEEL